MNSIKFLAAAYIATWVIHGTYLATLVRRFGRLRKESIELYRHTSASDRLGREALRRSN